MSTRPKHFGIDPRLLAQLGVLDPTLNVDTALFPDPLLIAHSQHSEICVRARGTYQSHFEKVIKLLRASNQSGDVAWRNAKRLMEFPEVKWTCLGYGASSVSGSGSGPFTTDGIMRTAKEIVDLGINDPDLFVALGIFEEGIGPDRIGDMTTNVILPDLLTFNQRVLSELRVPTKSINLILKNGSKLLAARRSIADGATRYFRYPAAIGSLSGLATSGRIETARPQATVMVFYCRPRSQGSRVTRVRPMP
jgi:hypothetical protein